MVALLLAGIPGTGACRPDSSRTNTPPDSTVTASASSTWQVLFDGQSLAGWHNFKTPGVLPVGWTAVDGELTRVGDGGDLVTDREYGDFELTLDWKVPTNGNSGIIYRIDPASEVTYMSGPEMQILDDAGHADGGSRLTSAGANYGLYPSPAGIVKPATEWNSIRLIVSGNHVEHWMNDVKMVDYELGSAEWTAKVAASKFAQWAGYGRATRGFIALQDHGDRVAFRNIRIRELP